MLQALDQCSEAVRALSLYHLQLFEVMAPLENTMKVLAFCLEEEPHWAINVGVHF